MMNRLQKKCLIATAGFHLLLVLIVLFGSAFFVSHPKIDQSQILEIIPINTSDLPFNSGVKGAQAPAPAPPQPQPPQPVQPRPQPPQPKTEPQPEPPQPKQTLVERVEKFFKPEPQPQPDDSKADEPEPKPTKPEPKKIKVSLDPVVRKTTKSTDTDNSQAEARREAQRLRDQRAKAFRSALNSISKNSSSATTVDMMPGASSVAYANYKDALASIYYDAWTPPDNTSNDDAITKVRIVIARDGSVISARIIGRSGDASVDASVQRAIDRVSSVPPLPEGTKESQRTVILNFNLKTKRMIG